MMFMKKTQLALILGLMLVAATPGRAKPDNVILILADDLGWVDTSLEGSVGDFYETPNLERLAEAGIRFSQAYAASPLCSPTRASILTGQNPARLGITAPRGHLRNSQKTQPSLPGGAAPDSRSVSVTSADVLDNTLPGLGKLVKAAGYATGHFGKWHLGYPPYSPLEHGFDVDIPHFAGPGPAGNFVAPWNFPLLDYRHPGEHIEDRMAEEAVAWMEEKVRAGERFYMHYWQFSVHAPFDAKPELVEKYRRKAKGDQTKSPTYAAMVESMDDAIGTLMDALVRLDIAGDTAVIFYSDNGGNSYNGIPETDVNGEAYVVEPTDNGPLRGGKATIYEGGVRVPAIFYWPGVTPADARSDALIQSTDLYPTILSLLDIRPPQDHPVDGFDITPALRGEDWERPAGLLTYFPHAPKVPDWLPPSISLREGDWKLIRVFHHGETIDQHGYKLYNLRDDLGERTNLAARYPERVAAMDQKIQDFIESAEVLTPKANPNFDPAQFKPEQIGIQPGGLRVGGSRAQRIARITGQKAQAGPAKLDRAPKGGKTLEGWTVPRPATMGLYKENGALVFDSTAGDPWMAYQLPRVLESGAAYTLKFEVKSDSPGGLRIYPGASTHSGFRAKDLHLANVPQADRWIELGVELETASGLSAIRISPVNRPGVSRFRNIRLEDSSGQVVAELD
jgi:arylsulfatase A-like enzyme